MDGNDVNRMVKEYIKIDDEIKDITNSVKDLRKTKTEYENQIKQYMMDNNIGKIELGNSGVLRVAKSKPTKAVNRKVVLEVLTDTFQGDHARAHDATEKIFNVDNLEEVVKLERKSKRN